MDQCERFLLPARLMANQAQEMQGVRILRLFCQDRAVKRFRIRQAAGLVLMKRED
jgi:hypothetical protein